MSIPTKRKVSLALAILSGLGITIHYLLSTAGMGNILVLSGFFVIFVVSAPLYGYYRNKKETEYTDTYMIIDKKTEDYSDGQE